MEITSLLNIIGVIAFSLSGVLKGLKHQLDIFGIIVLGTITATGGGIIRDILLNRTPRTIVNEGDIYLSIVISIIGYLIAHNLHSLGKLIAITDALGLAVFVIIGAEAAFTSNEKIGLMGTALMATLTGVGGGIIRDSLVREVPIVLKEDLYATLCIVGGMLYYVFKVYTKIPEQIYSNGIILLIFILRIIAIKYKLSLPRKKTIY
ncbi:MAG: trimeric intracellular cation channel family protein [Fusobacteriaceae bacterium]|nr:trimeric intracellular cation channel family protein [Fusobacteriaceae bacterium]MBN2838568.1 trimeric intracellular cation channel family protein [Fusobacteriaceae bacterium]